MRLRRGETVPALSPAQTPSLPVLGGVIISAVLTVARGLPPLSPHAEAARSAPGAQIITRISSHCAIMRQLLDGILRSGSLIKFRQFIKAL